MATAIRYIPIAEWDAYEWIDVRHLRDLTPVFVRGRKRELPPPPDDGFAYVRQRDPLGGDDSWVRAATSTPPPTED